MEYDTIQNVLLTGDCKDLLRSIPDDSVDLIVTSPPYADQRKHTYGGVTAGHNSPSNLHSARESIPMAALPPMSTWNGFSQSPSN